LYVCFSTIWGLSLASSYWDWKALLFNSMTLLIPIVTYSVSDKYLLQSLINKYIFICSPLFLVLQFFIGKDEYGLFLAPYSFVLLFLPILPTKWKLLILSIGIFVIFSDFGARSTVIKFTVAILFSILFYFRKYFPITALEKIRLFLIFIPFIFFLLGLTGIFNIFNPDPDSSIEILDTKKNFKGELINDNLLVDTRTTLYYEVITTLEKSNSWAFGRSPARGNISELFGERDLNKRNERNGNEVGVLNYFIWLGGVGVFLIFLIFNKASFLAINYSNNYFSKLVGLYIAFRWTYSWVEDMQNFYIGYIYLWLMIGFCFSSTFRKMSDKQMRDWVLNIFKFSNYPIKNIGRKYIHKSSIL
jgi:hypothetical protein